MRRITRLITGVTLFLMALGLLVVARATPICAQQAQVTPAGTCGQVIATIRQSVENKCKNLTGDHVCLGNRPVTVNTKDPTGATASTAIIALDAITSIFTDSLEPTQGAWGMAIVKARIDGTNDDRQAATFTLYGQASISKAEPPSSGAMPFNLTHLQAFYFSTGSGMQQGCAELPSGGLLIQSPTGQKITFAVNGMDVSLGSSVVLTAPPGVLNLYVLDGQVTVAARGQTRTAAGGQMFSIPLDPTIGLDVAGLPDAATAIDDNMRKNSFNQAGLCALVQEASVPLAVCSVSARPLQQVHLSQMKLYLRLRERHQR